MSDNPFDILLVESDTQLCDLIVDQLQRSVDCRVSVVETASDALREELTGQHELVILSAELPDDEDFSILREIRVTNHCPIIVLTAETRMEQAVEALQHQVSSWFEKPFDLAALVDAVREIVDRQHEQRREHARYQRLRRVAARIIREREDLNERMDLLCRDLVGAYRQLAEKVTESGILTGR